MQLIQLQFKTHSLSIHSQVKEFKHFTSQYLVETHLFIYIFVTIRNENLKLNSQNIDVPIHTVHRAPLKV
jgi:hypothetical protein